MEAVEDVVIVGAGIAGLATALGLHRKGIRSLVLESSDSLRASGFGLLTWTNAWKALDALGVGDSLRQQHIQLQRLIAASTSSGAVTSQLTFDKQGKCGKHEVRCLKRNLLLETLAKELPHGTIRYSSKLAHIEERGNFVLLHLADGSTLNAKVLIGCDGVNSVVAQWLGLKKPSFSGRKAIRGLTTITNGHGFKPEFRLFFGEGYRSGLLPCDGESVYWFFTWIPSKGNEMEENNIPMRQFLLSKLKTAKVPEEVAEVIEKSDMSSVVSSPLKYRWPFNLLWGNASKGSICVAGDAFHPATPEIGQGGCLALEDGVILAKTLSKALLVENGVKEQDRIEIALKKFTNERRWRCFDVVTTAYIVGFIQQSDGRIMNILREKFLSRLMTNELLNKANFDCGKL